MAKFTDLYKIDESEDNDLIEKRSDFIDLLEGLQDYFDNDCYGEKADTPEKVSKIYNTIADLECKFCDYEDIETNKALANDYGVQKDEIVEKLKKFADNEE